MTESDVPIKGWAKRAILNFGWLIVTTALLIPTGIVWPYQTWSWGLLLGAGAGGAAVVLVVVFVNQTGIDKHLRGGSGV